MCTNVDGERNRVREAIKAANTSRLSMEHRLL